MCTPVDHGISNPPANTWHTLAYRAVAMCETIRLFLNRSQCGAKTAPSIVEFPREECRVAMHSLYTGLITTTGRRIPPPHLQSDFYRDLVLTRHSGPGQIQDTNGNSPRKQSPARELKNVQWLKLHLEVDTMLGTVHLVMIDIQKLTTIRQADETWKKKWMDPALSRWYPDQDGEIIEPFKESKKNVFSIFLNDKTSVQDRMYKGSAFQVSGAWVENLLRSICDDGNLGTFRRNRSWSGRSLVFLIQVDCTGRLCR